MVRSRLPAGNSPLKVAAFLLLMVVSMTAGSAFASPSRPSCKLMCSESQCVCEFLHGQPDPWGQCRTNCLGYCVWPLWCRCDKTGFPCIDPVTLIPNSDMCNTAGVDDCQCTLT